MLPWDRRSGPAFDPRGTLLALLPLVALAVPPLAQWDAATLTVRRAAVVLHLEVAPKNITVGGGPMAVAANPKGTYLYVANYGTGTVSVINLAKDEVTTTITVGYNPTDVAVSPGRPLRLRDQLLQRRRWAYRANAEHHRHGQEHRGEEDRRGGDQRRGLWPDRQVRLRYKQCRCQHHQHRDPRTHRLDTRRCWP